MLTAGNSDNAYMTCRKGCGACCIAPSLSSPIPGMPGGKAPGVRCPHLTGENLCLLFESTERPAVCNSYRATREYCGRSREEALELLNRLEAETSSLFPREIPKHCPETSPEGRRRHGK